MANTTFKPVHADGSYYTLVCGSFAPNSSAAIDSASNNGTGWTVARSGTGIFTVTFADPFPGLISFTALAQVSVAAAVHANAGVYDATAQTIVLRTYSGGSIADIAAKTNNRINFTAVFRNSSLTT